MSTELEKHKRLFQAACEALGAINQALSLDPDDGGAEPILDAIAELKTKAAKNERCAAAFGAIVHNQVLAMQAAVIEAELATPLEGMIWIFNTLWGPGHLPDIDAAKEMGGAQAWFDAKTAEEAARLAALTEAAA